MGDVLNFTCACTENYGIITCDIIPSVSARAGGKEGCPMRYQEWRVAAPSRAAREELEQAGLDVPQVTKIAMALRRRGMDIDPAVYTIEELEQALLNRRGGGEKC